MWTTLKRLLLWFWALWLSLVVVFNVTDALKELGVLAPTFAYASGNLHAIREVLAPFDLPAALAGVLFACVIAWEALCAALYWWCGAKFAGLRRGERHALLVATFTASLGLWAALQIACEIFPSELAYELAGTHRLIFTETLATLLAVTLLPDD